MSEYELTVVLAGGATAAKKKSSSQVIETTVKLLKGAVLNTQDWGEIELAYKIKKNDSGSFLHFVLELEREAGKTMSEKLRLEDGIIRYLLIRRQ